MRFEVTTVRCWPRQALTQLQYYPGSLHIWGYRVNDGSLRECPGEIIEMLERRSVDTCCLKETRFRGKSVTMIQQKIAEYKLFWIENKKGFKKYVFLWL